MAHDKKHPDALPLARAFRLKELPGWIGKSLEVPPGRLGVVLAADGKGRTLPPGRHRLLTAWQRLRGRGVGLAAGYVPAGEFTLPLKAPYLISGDGEMLDLRLVGELEITDPLRYFTEAVIPQGQVWATEVDLSDETSQAALNAVTTRYTADDLIHDRPPRLAAELLAKITPLLNARGMGIRSIPLKTFSSPADRAVIAEKVQSVNEKRLQDPALEEKMKDIEDQAQLEDFARQLDPELGKFVSFQLDRESLGKGVTTLKARIGSALRAWLTVETKKGEGRRRWRLEGLIRQKQEEAKLPARRKIRRPPAYWWLPRTAWMIFVILSGLALTGLVNWIARAASWDNRLEVLLVIWGFMIGVILESIKVLYEKRESIEEATWMLPGYQRLDDLVGNDRRWADELVREQCQKELKHVRETLQDIRSREYERGKTGMALKLRNEVERNAEKCAEKVGRQDYGCPPYVTDLHVNRRAWLQMLDIDEDLLLYANALSDKAHLLQQKSHAGELTDEMVAEMDAEILKFCNRFFGRGRPLQTPPVEATN